MPCVIVPGNHDAFDGFSVYRRYDFEAAAPLVRVIRLPEGELIEYPAIATNVWARAMINHEPAFRPFVGAPRPVADRWLVVAGHGNFEEADQHQLAQVRSSPIRLQDLAGLGADYVALGHWDIPTRVGDGVVESWYSGAPALGGVAKVALLVTLDPDTGVAVQSETLESPGVASCAGVRLS